MGDDNDSGGEENVFTSTMEPKKFKLPLNQSRDLVFFVEKADDIPGSNGIMNLWSKKAFSRNRKKVTSFAEKGGFFS